MSHRFPIRVWLFLSLALLPFATGCRAERIHQLERRIDQLESRVANLEGRMSASTPK